jgi:hypothetical protein
MNDKRSKDRSLVPPERIERSMLLIRGQKVILDADLAALYGVETKQLIRAVKRNLARFPDDFMFQLNEEESENLRYHFGTSSQWGGRRYPPYAFTPLESPAIYSGDNIDKGSIPYRKGGVKAPLSNGVNGTGRGHALQCPSQQTRHSGEH